MLTKVTITAMYQHDQWMAKRLRASRRIQAKKSQPCQMRGAQAGFLAAGAAEGPDAMEIAGAASVSPRTAARGIVVFGIEHCAHEVQRGQDRGKNATIAHPEPPCNPSCRMPAPSTAADLPPPRDPRYLTLDAWRGLACLMIVVGHACGTLESEDWQSLGTHPAARLLRFGFAQLYLGVPLFFVISGYCISATVDSTRRKRQGPGQYFVRRFR